MSGEKEETPIVARAMQALVLVTPRAKYWRANSGGGKTGHRCNSLNLVDIVGWQADGKALAVEVKTATGKLTPEQYEFLRDVHDRGGFSAVYAPIARGGLEDFFMFGQVPARFIPPSLRIRGGLGDAAAEGTPGRASVLGARPVVSGVK